MATTKTLPIDFSTSEIPQCLCGHPGCLGHERIDGKIYVPGFTTQEAMNACPEEIVIFDQPLKPHVHEAVRALADEAKL